MSLRALRENIQRKGKAEPHTPLQRRAHLKNRLLSVSMEWHSRLLLLTSVVFTTSVQWIGALQKNTPRPLGRACSRQEVRCKGTAKESPGMTAGSTTGSAMEGSVSELRPGPAAQNHADLRAKGGRAMPRLTVRGWRAVKSQLHRGLKSVLHNEGGSNGDYFPSTAFHSYLKDHPDGRQGGELWQRHRSKRAPLRLWKKHVKIHHHQPEYRNQSILLFSSSVVKLVNPKTTQL